jgi:RimJ/RimL family protein N-acetyltransferase
MAHPHWPLFDVTVRTPRLELVAITDEIAVQLADLALRGVHDRAFMPFALEWTDAPAADIPRNLLQYQWRCRADWTPARWRLNLATVVDGEVVGSTGLFTDDFGVVRTFETGSWLGLAHQGRGIGTEMRVATLHLGFVGLDALEATTGAFVDNGASLGVTRKLGYRPNGVHQKVRRGEAGTLERFVMSRDDFDANVRRDDVEVSIPAAAVPLFGLGASTPS